MTVVVIGGAGLIGQATIAELVDRGEATMCADVHTDVTLPDAVETRRCDVTGYAETLALLEAVSPDAVINLAYVVGADVLADLPTSLAVNVQGADTVFRAAAEAGVPRVVWPSSIGIYGDEETYDAGMKITEETKPYAALSQFGSVSYYGAMKQFNEYQMRVYAAATDLRITAIRPSVVFGPRRSSGFPWLADLVERAVAGEARIPLDPGAEISLIHVDDIARLFADVATAAAPAHDVYLSGGHDVSMERLAAVVEAESGGDVACEPGGGPGPLVTNVDNRRAREEFGFRLTPLGDSIRADVEAVRSGR